jgi:peptidoglycan/xylan/chitin deacetylase (PgdA/CDA1 family)
VTFHRVLPRALIREYALGELCVTPEELDWYLRFFSRHFDCRTLADAGECFETRAPEDPPLLAVTFDDGQRDNYLYARPVLERAQVPASFFVPSRNVEEQQPLWHDRLADAVRALLTEPGGGTRRLAAVLGPGAQTGPDPCPASVVERAKRLPRAERESLVGSLERAAGTGAAGSRGLRPRPDWDGMMTWRELGELAEAGHEIGGHSMTHPILPLCDEGELRWEAGECRQLIEQRLGREVLSFCYPNGSWDARTLAAVREAGYRWGVTTEGGLNSRETPPLLLQRWNMDSSEVRLRSGQLSPALLAWRISGLYPRGV